MNSLKSILGMIATEAVEGRDTMGCEDYSRVRESCADYSGRAYSCDAGRNSGTLSEPIPFPLRIVRLTDGRLDWIE